MKKKFLIFSFFIIFILGLIFGGKPETNLLKAILPDSQNILAKLAERSSSLVNVIFEGESEEAVENLKLKFEDKFEIYSDKNDDISSILLKYKKSHMHLLSNNTRKLLLQKNFNQVVKNSQEELYNPISIMVLSPDIDPFLLLTDYEKCLMSLQPQYRSEFNNKFYSVSNFDISKFKNKNEIISKIVEFQKVNKSDKSSVYLAGAPVHSYFTSGESVREINFISILSLLFVLSLAYYYFGTAKVLVPIVISIGLGIACGYFLTASIFHNVHILTFVFSTTLIGICVDYSLHYFVEQDISKLSKSLTISMLTTVFAFFILLFSGIPLLKQISVFTSTGLITVYFLVLVFYPQFLFKFRLKRNFSIFHYDKTFKIILSIFCSVFVLIGLVRLNFSDDIKSMYKPNKMMLKSEILYKNLSISQVNNFIVVKGKTFQEILQNEEKIVDKLSANSISTIALSDFIPSINRQLQNKKLIEELYENKLFQYANFLNFEQKMNLMKNQPDEIFDNIDSSVTKNFLIDKNHSVIIVKSSIPKSFSDKNSKVVNVSKDISSLMHQHRKTCLLLSIIVVLFLIPYLYFNFKKQALIVLLPSIIGIFVSLAFLGITNQAVNLFHIFAMFLILGFTLDYSIFRISNIKNSGGAVFISFLTTSFSFLLLSFTSFKLISSLGLVLFIGISTAYLASLILIDFGDKNEMV